MTNPSIIVPDWQRNYSWQSGHIETFWNDLVRFVELEGGTLSGEYFLGSVVLVRTVDGRLNLLDGQQRLATSAILLSCIRDFVKNSNQDAAKGLQSSYLVGYDHVKNAAIHKLRLNIYDRDFFRRCILEFREGNYTEPKPDIASHYLIRNARILFEEYILEYLGGAETAAPNQVNVEKIMHVANALLNHMTVISVESSDEDSAAAVFETLNDRGIGLSTPDLLRNLVIRRANEGEREDIVELWKDVVSFDSDARIKNFLRHYWVSKHGDVKTQSLYREIKYTIERDSIESKLLSQELSDSASLYKQIIRADTDSKLTNNLLEQILEFGSSSNILLPVVLGILETLNDDDGIAAIERLLNVFVRHSIISSLENSRLENKIYRAVRNLRENKDVKEFIFSITEGGPDNDELRKSFSRLSLTHNGSRRSILRRMEMHLRTTEELEVSSPDNVHVEHIYPQKPDGGIKWTEHDKWINRIGNLTLLSARLNKSIRNSDFAKKLPAYKESEIVMTSSLGDFDDWNEAAIEARQNKLSDIIAEVYSVS